MSLDSAELHTPKRGVPPTSSRHVLIVDDDAGLRDMMAEFLTLEGFQTWAVANGREALDYLHSSLAPRVILLDLMMPVMDGWEFLQRRQADPALAGVPVIVLSAFDHARSEEFDAAAVLKKPVEFDRLLALVRSYFP